MTITHFTSAGPNPQTVTDYVTLGRSGLRVSPICLRTMTFGTESGWGMEEALSRAIFSRYLEAGGNFFDCANSYARGTSETLLGGFVKESGSRSRTIIATKFTRSVENGNPNAVGNGRNTIQLSLEQSLKRLQTDYIDLYWMHSWDKITPAEEVIATLDGLVKAGNIRYYGLSDVPAWYAARTQTLAEKDGRERVVALQLEYSLIERAIEREHVPAAQELGMAVCPWGVTASGFLTGKYRAGDGGVHGDGRLREGGPQIDRFTERNWGILKVVLDVAGTCSKTPAQIALNWVASQPGITAPIIGVTSLAQLDEQLAAAAFIIPEELRRELDEASALPLVHPYNIFDGALAQQLAGGVKVRQWAPARFR